ncbi:MAG TPA: carbohydrate ABC transporter permease [Ruminiclostridium sp.]
MKFKRLKHRSKGDLILDAIVYFSLIMVFILTFYPFWNIFIVSVNDATDTVRGGLYLWPRIFTLASYKAVFTDNTIVSSLYVTIARTVIGTLTALLVTTMLAYALSKRELVGRKYFNTLFIFTMYFSGGLIPFYMVLKSLGLIDSFWVFIFPSVVSVFYMILIRTYIEGLPAEMEESALIDGANEIVVFIKIILPLCKPIIATVALFIAVGQWNSWFDSYVFTYSPKLVTLQAALVKILNQYQTGSMQTTAQQFATSQTRNPVSSDSIKMATTMVATLPIVMIYPFLQRYFVKGIMIGAVKA